PGKENLRHLEASELARPGEVRVVEPLARERFALHGFRPSDDAGHEPREGFHDRESSGLAAREDEIPEGQLFVEQPELSRPVVEPLVASAEETEARPAGSAPAQ